MRDYIAAELGDLRQQASESLPDWLLQLWSTGATGIILTGMEMSKLASIMTHPSLYQHQYTALSHEERELLLGWIVAARKPA